MSVTRLGLGGGALGGLYDPVAPEVAEQTVQRAYELGIRYFDTAPLYGHGRSEERLGRALSGVDRSTYVLGTKVGLMIEPRTGSGAEIDQRYADPFILDGRYDFSRDACMRSLESSMLRLGTDRIDIVYIHDPDEGDSALPLSQRTGVDHMHEVMTGAYPALDELRAQGVIGAIGVGVNGTDLLVQYAAAGNFDCFLLAGRYTLLEQDGLDELLPICVEHGTSIVIGGVFNSGILATGAVGSVPTYNYVEADAATIERVCRIDEVCREYEVRLSAAALQFPLAHEAVVTVIPGVRSPEEVERNVADASASIPAAFWHDLVDAGLVHPGAPIPSSVPSGPGCV